MFYLLNVVVGRTAKPLLDLHGLKRSFFCESWSFPSLKNNKKKKMAVSKIHLVHLILHERAVIKNSSCSYSRSQPMEPKAAHSKRGNTHNRLAVYYRAHADKHTIHSHSTRQFLAYISLECGKKLKFNPDKYSSWKLQGPRFKPTLYVRQQCKPLNHGTTTINKW